ncbi:sigma-54-dependent transcriptional regulator [Terriglobus roseus]|uniref:DNA-binding transcriptional response regulator, NtrC family, contains REC, AAA-type ATPase, and a Fis-type DNA-binding domains n=1 Tax=Terriglobus roseus TaxID=392734 RepID=A0A1H4IRR7_9BACT|nr:sigma-54 dependent transcriptional regulator [Terriglobus roseus]SEB36760.1 DNA-binding transcriptional response regulator, NtrC family, contains REC, AAA-type ATPase, and a Fis-type DNA-binding domains [Terriglobus roseus]
MSTAVSVPMQQRSVVLVTPDADLRHRLTARLSSLRWNVLSAAGGAEAMVHLGGGTPEAMIVDHWLPDLDAAEFTAYAAALCPGTDMLQMDGSAASAGSRSSRRNELLHALREAQQESHETAALPIAAVSPTPFDGAAWLHAPVSIPSATPVGTVSSRWLVDPFIPPVTERPAAVPMEVRMHLPEMVGNAPQMLELARLVRMVAPHMASVLIQGETGTGKELVAKAVHRLSHRANKPFVVLNCAAIPEHLLEAELFGHTRGAFTGAVTSRTGRIEAAHGGTLFLDEIGEMPLPLQAKMLRFLENGEIQKVGDNDTVRVDVRIVAATHQPLEQNADDKVFRLDLYHRLAVFPVDVPTLRDRTEDIPMLTEYFLRKFGESAPRRSILPKAIDALMDYQWPGNVRELAHMLQRAIILCGEDEIRPEHFRIRSAFA